MALLPKELPPRSTVYDYFRRCPRVSADTRPFGDGAGACRAGWADGTLLAVYHALHARARVAVGREPQPSAGIVDSQSVKTAEAGGPRGFDAGKKVPPRATARVRFAARIDRRLAADGRKRHLLVDTLGLPLRAIVHPANIQDRDGVAPLLARIRRRFPFDGACAPSIRCADRIDASGVDG